MLRLFAVQPTPTLKKMHRFVLAAFAAVLFATAPVFAGDPSGTWTWTRQGRDGQAVEASATLQFADGKLSGTVTGFRGSDAPISDGKVDGDLISFNVVMNFNGNSFTIAYQGKLDGDTITGTITRPDRDGGGTRQSDWKATRKK